MVLSLKKYQPQKYNHLMNRLLRKIQQNIEKSPSEQKLSKVCQWSRIGKTKKLPKCEWSDFAFREKKSEYLSYCCADVQI